MTTKNNPVTHRSRVSKAAPVKKASGKTVTTQTKTRASSKSQSTSKAPAAASRKKASVANATGFEGLSIEERCTRIELVVRELATVQGKEAVAYRKHLSNVFHFSYELAQTALGSNEDLDIGQAQLSDELDNSPLSDLVDSVSDDLSADDAETLSVALRREEVRLAFLLK